MSSPIPGSSMPAGITALQAQDAFHHIFDLTDWRLRVIGLDPISIGVEHDEGFGEYLDAFGSWKASDISRAWITNRIIDGVSALTKSYLRTLHLQHPHSLSDTDTKVFLAHLRWRLELDIRSELLAHFDTSIVQWESDVRDFIDLADDRELASRVFFHVGLDQVVSTDAVRKAIKMVFTRMHWGLEGKGAGVTILSDHRFNFARSRRSGRDDMRAAQSLVVRAVEVICDDYVRRARDGHELAELTRASIRDTIEQRFRRDGVWGLIDMVIVSDRARYYIATPDAANDDVAALVERQRVRL